VPHHHLTDFFNGRD